MPSQAGCQASPCPTHLLQSCLSRPLISPVPRTGLAAFGSRNLGCPPDSQDHAWGRGAQAVAWRSQVCMGTCYSPQATAALSEARGSWPCPERCDQAPWSGFL